MTSNQKKTEIAALLRLLTDRPPECVCEIGAAGGGTLALFAFAAAPNARILSIDLDYPRARRAAYRRLAGRRQKITCIQGSSHARDTLGVATDWLRGGRLDFLFIDGDHSYEGVKSDYEMYGPLVRTGGIIAFHDIHADFHTRFGIKTSADVGEVPRFWAELKSQGIDARELVEDGEQDGYGIGVVRVSGGLAT